MTINQLLLSLDKTTDLDSGRVLYTNPNLQGIPDVICSFPWGTAEFIHNNLLCIDIENYQHFMNTIADFAHWFVKPWNQLLITPQL